MRYREQDIQDQCPGTETEVIEDQCSGTDKKENRRAGDGEEISVPEQTQRLLNPPQQIKSRHPPWEPFTRFDSIFDHE